MIPQSLTPHTSSSAMQWVGIVSLPPLPGTAGWTGSLSRFWDQLAQEALALSSAGVDALVIENTADSPYRSQGTLDSLAVSILTRAVQTVQDITQKPVGLGVLPNDPVAALHIALASEAAFVRVRLLAGSLQTPAGVLSANPAELIDAAHRARQQDLQSGSWPKLWIDAPATSDAADALRAVLPALNPSWLLSGMIYDDIDTVYARQPDHPEMTLPHAAWRLPAALASVEAFAPYLDRLLANPACTSIWIGPGFEKPISTARYGRPTLDAVQLERFVQTAKKRLSAAMPDDPDRYRAPQPVSSVASSPPSCPFS